MNPTIEDTEDGWFGEGSAFDSGEDLAAALMELAGHPAGMSFAVAPEAAAPSAPPEFEVQGGSRDLTFELLRPARARSDSTAAGGTSVGRWASANQPATWTVRTPGSADVPSRQPGKTGWSIRSSVQMLRRTEEVLLKLREEAVDATLVAASRAIKTAS